MTRFLPTTAWVRAFGAERAQASAVAIEQAGRDLFYVAGLTRGPLWVGRVLVGRPDRQPMLFVLRMDHQGRVEWVAQAGPVVPEMTRHALALVQDRPVLAGTIDREAAFGELRLRPGAPRSAFVAALDAAGNWQWARAASSGTSQAHGVSVTAHGIAVVGQFQGALQLGDQQLESQGGQDIFVATLDAEGNWTAALRGGSDEPAIGWGGPAEAARAVTSWRGAEALYLAGTHRPGARLGAHNLKHGGTFLARVDATTLNAAWVSRVPPPTEDAPGILSLHGMELGPEGELVVVGDGADHTRLVMPADARPLVARLNPDGGWVWMYLAPLGVQHSPGLAAAVDSLGSVYATGVFHSRGRKEFAYAGEGDILLFRLNPDGQLIWSRTVGGVGQDAGNDLVLDGDNNLYVVGSFSEHVDFGGPVLDASGASDAMVWKLSYDSVTGPQIR